MTFDINNSLLHLLHRATQAADELYVRNSGVGGITPRQLVVLSAVSNKEDVSQTEIVDATGIDRSTLADMVRRIQKAGLIVRKRAKNDARAYEVRLTPKGRNVLGAAGQVALQSENELASGLKARQRDELSRLLQDLVDTAAKSKAGKS